MKTLVILISILSSLAAFAELKEGVFSGRINDTRKSVELMLKKAPGRDGSFIAIINKDDEKISAYLVDPSGAGRYTMTPFSVAEDGEITIINDNPSLVLVESDPVKWHDEVNYRITSANSDNDQGINGFMNITDKVRRKSWIDLRAGTYRVRSNRNAVTLSSFDELEGESNAVFSTEGINGAFVVREKIPFLFSINVNSSLRSGDEVATVPRKIGIFVKKRRKVYFILIDPQDDSNILKFKLR